LARNKEDRRVFVLKYFPHILSLLQFLLSTFVEDLGGGEAKLGDKNVLLMKNYGSF
jgi:hypothetical protein